MPALGNVFADAVGRGNYLTETLPSVGFFPYHSNFLLLSIHVITYYSR
jgi:hypothetical protein